MIDWLKTLCRVCAGDQHWKIRWLCVSTKRLNISLAVIKIIDISIWLCRLLVPAASSSETHCHRHFIVCRLQLLHIRYLIQSSEISLETTMCIHLNECTLLITLTKLIHWYSKYFKLSNLAFSNCQQSKAFHLVNWISQLLLNLSCFHCGLGAETFWLSCECNPIFSLVLNKNSILYNLCIY